MCDKPIFFLCYQIAAVCELLNYLRYIKNGLVKACSEDVYWEIIRLRKQISLAKLGILSTWLMNKYSSSMLRSLDIHVVNM